MTINDLIKKFQRKNKHHGRSTSLIYTFKDYPKQKEAFLRIRDNILFYAIDENKKVIQIASSVSFEAKTTVVSNLGVTLAESNKKVLLMDFDFRKPKLHRPFNIENKDGLSDYLLGLITKNKMIKSTAYPNLSVINCGKVIEDSSIIFESKKFKNLMKELKKEFDFILLDSSPILLVSDYINISKFSDGILFAVAYGITKKQQVNESINLLRQLETPIIGSVFTFFDSKKTNSYNDYYYNYSYNYHSYHTNNEPDYNVGDDTYIIDTENSNKINNQDPSSDQLQDKLTSVALKNGVKKISIKGKKSDNELKQLDNKNSVDTKSDVVMKKPRTSTKNSKSSSDIKSEEVIKKPRTSTKKSVNKTNKNTVPTEKVELDESSNQKEA